MTNIMDLLRSRALILSIVSFACCAPGAEVQAKYLGSVEWKIEKDGNFIPASMYPCTVTAYVDLSDPDIEGQGTVVLATTSTTGDTESITLHEIGGITGVFRGTIPLSASDSVPGNGTLATMHEGIVRVEYVDAFNNAGQQELVFDTAVTRCPGEPPCLTGPSLGAGIDDPPIPTTCVGCVTAFRVKVSNSGCATLEGDATVDPPFHIVAGSHYVIAAGDPPVFISLQFRPTEAGVNTRMMSLTGDGPTGDGVVLLKLSATALDTAPTINATPTRIDFGSVNLGQSGRKAITIKNSACGGVTGTATVSPPFYISSGANYDVSCGASAQVTVEFRPEVYGHYEDVVVLTGGGGTEVPVSGYGQGKRDFVHLMDAGPKPESSFPQVKADVIVDTPAGHACELLQEDFALTENGVAQTITSFACGQTRAADVVVLFDDSGSISPIMHEMMDHVHTLVDTIDADPTIGLGAHDIRCRPFPRTARRTRQWLGNRAGRRRHSHRTARLAVHARNGQGLFGHYG
jgi:hypothetical protein